jgi:CheY-like chemotaxis protein
VVSEMEKMLRRLISEDITITTRLSPDLGNVLADAGQIEQIIMNLVVNARDAVGSGGRIHIETSNEILDSTYAAQHMEVKPGPYVRFAVSDTGTGISKEVIEKIFEPFFTTKEKGKGTGLGLATVYGVVKQSGGYIWVYSEEGKGTTFKIYLPRVYLPDEARPEDLQPMDTPGNQTILLVEDELMVRDLAQRILEGAGYKVIAMHDGKAAQSLSDEELRAVDLLLSDVIMPDISGPALAMQLVQRHPKLRHLYMSGYTDDAILQHGVLEQGLKFIGKPFTARNLLRKVAETLQAEVSPLA